MTTVEAIKKTGLKTVIKKMVREFLEKELMTSERDTLAIKEKIIVTYDAGQKFNESDNETAKSKIIRLLYGKGVRVFHSPTRSTIIFLTNQSGSFAYWHKELTNLFNGSEFSHDLYYSIALIPAGPLYDDNPNEELNDGIDTIISSLQK